METKTIEIVDIGRGPQLSTNRITVQDVVPYLQEGCSHDEILRWMPALSAAELALVAQYYRAHQAELEEEDIRIRTQVAEQVRLQRQRFPEESRDVRLARIKDTLLRRQKERNGEGHPG
jgi:uncharacterized protein (DUF433 family)